jgi:hypothetical protein
VRQELADAPIAPPYPAGAERSDALLVDPPDSVSRADAMVRRRLLEQRPRVPREWRARPDEARAAREW